MCGNLLVVFNEILTKDNPTVIKNGEKTYNKESHVDKNGILDKSKTEDSESQNKNGCMSILLSIIFIVSLFLFA